MNGVYVVTLTAPDGRKRTDIWWLPTAEWVRGLYEKAQKRGLTVSIKRTKEQFFTTMSKNKQETIKYLTDLMGTIQMAYYKGKLGNEIEGYVGDLRVHETGEAGVSIDLYHFEGDGLPVCEGLDFDAVCPADMQLIHQQAYCISYDPDWEEHPVLIQCDDQTGSDDSFELTLDNVPEDTLKHITAWIESQMPKGN